MLIDCHTHLGRNDHINCTADQLLKSMDQAGIDKALVYAGLLNDCPNEWMLEQIAPHKDRLLGVAAANPVYYKLASHNFYPYYNYGDLANASYFEQEEVKKITDWYGEGKIVACKFYTGYEHFMPSEVPIYLEALNQVRCPAIFHSGDCLNSVKCAKLKYAHPMNIDEVAVDYPDMSFIIAHMGWPLQRETALICSKNHNVYTDVSGFVYGDFSLHDEGKFDKVIMDFMDISDESKLLFGTDFPISNQLSYIDAVNSVRIPSVSTKVLSDNVAKVFNIK